MYRDVAEGGAAIKVIEKSEKSRKEFFAKCEKIKKENSNNKKLHSEVMSRSAQEYNKLFGRIGVHPLMLCKGGKKRPRYLVDRDEVWVMYKPALWQMGGTENRWRKNIRELSEQTRSQRQAEEQIMKSERIEVLQEWHGLMTGLEWLPTTENGAGHGFRGWGFIQRLDAETDGPVMICKTWRAMRCIQTQMKLHVNTKAYMCLVHGRVPRQPMHIRRKFAELGVDAATQVMLQHDEDNDPFYDWSARDKAGAHWTDRSIRQAETFYQPLAYYHRKEDDSDYTLVYVNILSGITHQIRITMQSIGHPLVSDDRYLPREQAMADLKWCPRNFLTCVRSDFFDLTGPHKDPARKRYTRVSIENPLPKLFQIILTNKLELREKLVPSADLFVGPEYWSIGDAELMSAFPKSPEYRQKVMRWGARRGIHVDALDRLLLLSQDDIDDVLSRYSPPSKMGAEKNTHWICPECMHWNEPRSNGFMKVEPDICDAGGSGKHTQNTALGKSCGGRRQVGPDFKQPDGWYNWADDPTVHLLYVVNQLWLDARRKIFRMGRPAWETPPMEHEGSEATPQMLKALEVALVAKAKEGEVGLHESELRTIPELRMVTLPLVIPAGSAVNRVRLPGQGSFSQWTYTLSAAKRIEWSDKFQVKPERLPAPIPMVRTDPLPPLMVSAALIGGGGAADVDADVGGGATGGGGGCDGGKGGGKDGKDGGKGGGKGDGKGGGKSDGKGGGKGDGKGGGKGGGKDSGKGGGKGGGQGRSAPLEPLNAIELDVFTPEPSSAAAWAPSERPRAEPAAAERRPLESGGGGGSGSAEPAAKKARLTRHWERRESKSNPGQFYYLDVASGETSVEKPPDFDSRGSKEPAWERIQSKSSGQWYYFNHETGENRVERPLGVDLRGEAPKEAVEDLGRWERKESASKPGNYFYFNMVTGENDVQPPLVDHPWSCLESKTKPGQFYYYHEVSGEVSVNPPPMARSSRAESAAAPAPAAAAATNGTGSDTGQEKLAANWVKKRSEKFKGKLYYINSKTGESSWEPPSPWDRVDSSSKPGTCYYRHCQTGETSWETQVVGAVAP